MNKIFEGFGFLILLVASLVGLLYVGYTVAEYFGLLVGVGLICLYLYNLDDTGGKGI